MMIRNLIDDNYQNHTYDELSQEFKGLYPSMVRAFELVPQMYNRLTLVDKLTHKEAVGKMYNDHKDLPGFSPRNIQRYLPADNPNKPSRVVTSRHKSSDTAVTIGKKLMITKLYPIEKRAKDNDDIKPLSVSSKTECPNCRNLLTKIQELEEALKLTSKFSSANVLIGSEQLYSIPKEKWYMLTDAIKKSDKTFFIISDKRGNFVYAESDIDRMKHASNNRLN